jgi:hypothetical protein
MNRRAFLKTAFVAASFCCTRIVTAQHPALSGQEPLKLDPALATDWLKRWKERILGGMNERFCDHAMGEDVGWLMSPFLNGFYHGYLATHDVEWVAHLADWADSWIKRGVKDPDGFIGWPKRGESMGGGNGLLTESLLAEAMALRPIVLMADQINRTPALREKFGVQAKSWLDVAARTFEKWDSFGCWREVKDGGLWVVPDFGIDPVTGKWTSGYQQRATNGFSNPDNKQNHIARWLLAMHDVTKKPVYHDRAEKWFRLMKSRMHTQQGGKYFVWNYWEPGGPWDYKPDGETRHWVGVHPNGGYYEIDLEGIVAAYEHGIVFTREDIQKLIATNRDFMWNQQMKGARFQRIDGGQPDPRWKETPGKLWTALVPHDATLRQIFLKNFDPASWEGLSVTPWFLARSNSEPN